MVGDLVRRYKSHQMAWNSILREPEDIWKPPDPGNLKINYDVVVAEGNLFLAAICCNSLGTIVLARTCKIDGRSPIKGEAWAARLACQMAGEVGNQM
ncbi:hypothetical protein CJ030_MR2G011925 [Morella rubra]|uniref:RNase H type-1 domain-containing protein n=1 Tax=Morella rubra TaxID=262757 RepID=A0A6A1WHR4_9ROSI|nr:hypothetical protein CJ030_MR2G011925 [Morella rubra]